MSKIFLILVLLSLLEFCSPSCFVGKNYCKNCNPVSDLCIRCEYDSLKPDKEGGCKGNKKCIIGKNFCEECSEEEDEENLCKKCNIGYFPDLNGGCSYTANCAVSYRGECLVCQDDFILIGKKESIKFCKSINSNDLLNCKTINYENGLCLECEEDFYLNADDKKCTETENCSESIYSQCISCINGYYLDHKNKNSCKLISENESFLHCKETEDGKKCSKCEDTFYLDEEGNCADMNYCSHSENFVCKKCIDDYYFTNDKKSCTPDKNCNRGEKNIGICIWCNEGFYLDTSDGKCKTNKEDDDLKYCTYFKGGKCINCAPFYYLSSDSKCSQTQYCDKVEEGECVECFKDYHLGVDKKCTNIDHCIKSDYSSCKECEENYYYNQKSKSCVNSKGDEVFENCKISNWGGKICEKCKDEYYINLVDNLCYSNQDKKGKFYRCSTTDRDGKVCNGCIEGYFLGSKDKKCSPVEFCTKSENDICQECSQWDCLDVKLNKCEYNDDILYEDKKMYYNCLKTNKEGTKCAECLLSNYTLTDEGLCVDNFHCDEQDEDGNCIKCNEKTESGFSNYCLNEIFGCIENYSNKNCLRCDDILHFELCTECLDGFELVNGFCVLKQ